MDLGSDINDTIVQSCHWCSYYTHEKKKMRPTPLDPQDQVGDEIDHIQQHEQPFPLNQQHQHQHRQQQLSGDSILHYNVFSDSRPSLRDPQSAASPYDLSYGSTQLINNSAMPAAGAINLPNSTPGPDPYSGHYISSYMPPQLGQDQRAYQRLPAFGSYSSLPMEGSSSQHNSVSVNTTITLRTHSTPTTSYSLLPKNDIEPSLDFQDRMYYDMRTSTYEVLSHEKAEPRLATGELLQSNLPPQDPPRTLPGPSTNSKGKTKRSRGGCLTCRQRKKRCCETKPVCAECKRLSIKCRWPVPGSEHKNRPKSHRSPRDEIKHEVFGVIKILRGVVDYKAED